MLSYPPSLTAAATPAPRRSAVSAGDQPGRRALAEQADAERRIDARHIVSDRLRDEPPRLSEPVLVESCLADRVAEQREGLGRLAAHLQGLDGLKDFVRTHDPNP